MMRKLTIALLSISLGLSITIIIRAHCGSSWDFAQPTFSPTLNVFDCLHGSTDIVGDNPTQTTKEVSTTIQWTVGQPITVPISDLGQNRRDAVFGGGVCTRCFPDFFTPEFADIGDGVTEWSQTTRASIALGIDTCAPVLGPGPNVHRFGRDCHPTEEECESSDYSWFWNPTSDSCQQNGPPPCDLLPEVCENGQWSLEWCACDYYPTPIVVDIKGNGFNLTSAVDGVTFNANNRGGKEKLAWTSSNSDDAWLVLDRNGNGMIDDGSELFGDATVQPEPPAGEKKNGFRALAEYDRRANGGNEDGQIDSNDSVFSALRLWQDSNHNGISEPNELHTLPSLNLAMFELDYKSAKKTDSNGNQFNFRAKVKNSQGHQLGRWAWDVYLVK